MRWLLALVLIIIPMTANAEEATPYQRSDSGAVPVAIGSSDPLPAPVSLELPSQERLAYCILIENRREGVIRVFDPPAQYLFQRPGEDIGRVIRPAHRLKLIDTAASITTGAGVITASALAGISFNAQAGVDGSVGMLEIWPGLEIAGSTAPPAPAEHVLQADMLAGYGIFGGAFAGIVLHCTRNAHSINGYGKLDIYLTNGKVGIQGKGFC